VNKSKSLRDGVENFVVRRCERRTVSLSTNLSSINKRLGSVGLVRVGDRIGNREETRGYGWVLSSGGESS
jgi:hypothetical protein